MASEEKREMSSAYVLAAALIVAIGLWLLWVLVGAGFVKGYLSEHTGTRQLGRTESASIVHPQPQDTQARSDAMAELGQSGDAFGGVNALFAAIAGALLLWGAVLQHRSLREARAATKLAEKAYNDARTATKHDQFASIFFQMLTLSRQLVERIEVENDSSDLQDGSKRLGAAALEHLAWKLARRLEIGGQYIALQDRPGAKISSLHGSASEQPAIR